MSKLKILLSVIIGVGTNLIAGSALLAAEDAVPPSTVGNLAIESATQSTVGIKWTAPGDDGSTGTASSYDMRFRAEPITESNFATSSLLAINHGLGINGLATTTPYHFSVSSSDVFGNTATSTDRTFITLGTTTPPTATTTIQARLQLSPSALNSKKPGKRIQAIIRLPKGTTFEGLETNSIKLNGTIIPVDTNLRPAIWKRWGKYRKTLIAKFKTEDILPLIPNGAEKISLTITGNVKAGIFSATDSIKIVPKPKKVEIKIDKLEKRLEDARERLRDRQEDILERFKKQEDKLKERIENLSNR